MMEIQAIVLAVLVLFHPRPEINAFAKALPHQHHNASMPHPQHNASTQPHRHKAQQGNEITLAKNSLLKCVPGSGDLDTMHETALYLMDLQPDFRYLQVSLRLGSCVHHPVYRGSTFITNRDVVPRGSRPQARLTISYTRTPDGSHTYRVDGESLGLHRIVNTSDTCGEFQGFRLRVKGALMCELQWPNNNSLGVKVGQARVQAKFSFSTLHELRRWANGAYVMAICFTLTTYILFLLASHFQKRVQYSVVTQDSV